MFFLPAEHLDYCPFFHSLKLLQYWALPVQKIHNFQKPRNHLANHLDSDSHGAEALDNQPVEYFCIVAGPLDYHLFLPFPEAVKAKQERWQSVFSDLPAANRRLIKTKYSYSQFLSLMNYCLLHQCSYPLLDPLRSEIIHAPAHRLPPA